MMIHGTWRMFQGVRQPADSYVEAVIKATKSRRSGYTPLFYVREMSNGMMHCFFACQDNTKIGKHDFLFHAISVKKTPKSFQKSNPWDVRRRNVIALREYLAKRVPADYAPHPNDKEDGLRMDADAAHVVKKLDSADFSPVALLGAKQVKISLQAALKSMMAHLPLSITGDKTLVKYEEVTMFIAKILEEGEP